MRGKRYLPASSRSLAMVVAVVVGGFGHVALGETLEEALAQAYLNNPTLLSQRAALRSTDEGVPQALAGWRPTVSMSATFAEQYGNSSSGGTVTKGTAFEKGAQVSVSQNIFDGFQTESQVDQAENLVLAARADLATTEQTVLFDAVSAFMNVLRDQAVLELNINNVQVLRRELEATQDRFEVGEVTRTDVSQAQSRLARAEAERVLAEGNLEISRANYKQVIGTPPGELVEPKPYSDLPKTLESAQALASNDNPSVVSALYVEKAARDNVDVNFGALLPSVSLDGSYSYFDSPAIGTSTAEMGFIGATVTIPIYQAGTVYSEVRQSKQIVSQRRVEIAEAKRAALENATSTWETLVSARASVKAFEQEVEASRIALEGVQEESQAGLRTVLDVLDAEQEYLNARVDLVTSKTDEVIASYNLLSAIGELTALSLRLEVPYYDPGAYYKEVRDKWWGTGKDPYPPAPPE
jgi:outer membrane protein